jgi:hypothetical protein
MGADATKEYGHVKQSGSMSWNSLRESSSCDKVEKLLEWQQNLTVYLHLQIMLSNSKSMGKGSILSHRNQGWIKCMN